MFTGLTQSIGTISPDIGGLVVKGCEPFSPIGQGDSIAVDGVCLTATKLSPGGFLADVSEETLSRTTLGDKSKVGSYVNLEPAIRLSDRLGGHLVSGHVDGIGQVINLDELSTSWLLGIRLKDQRLFRYICEKGSIAINGISLTIASLSGIESNSFSVAVIPHTWYLTNLKYLKLGDFVNLEVDLMAKYAERLLMTSESSKEDINNINNSEGISEEWLTSQGWT